MAEQQSNFTPTPALELIGVDAPSARQAAYQTSDATAIQPDKLILPGNAETKALEESQRSLQQINEQEQNSINQRTASLLQGTQATGKSIADAQETALQQMRARVTNIQSGVQQFQLGLGAAAGIATSIQARRDAEKAAQEQALQQMELAQATQAIEEFRTRQAESGLMQNGTGVAQQELAQILSKYQRIPTKEIEGLLKRGYEPIQTYATKSSNDLLSTMKEERSKVAENMAVQYKIALSQTVAKLSDPSTTDTAGLMDKIQEHISRITLSPDLDNLQKLTITHTVLTAAAEALDKNSVGYQELQSRIKKATDFINANMLINERIRSGEISPEQGAAELEQSAIINGQKSSASPISADINIKTALEGEQTKNALEKLRQDGLISSLDKVELDNAQLGAVTWEAINNPALLEQAKNDPVMSKTAFWKSVISTAELYRKSREEISQLRTKSAAAAANIKRYQAQGIEDFVKEAAKPGTPANQRLTSEGDALILGLLAQARSRPLNQEELNTIATAREQYLLAEAEVVGTYTTRVQEINARLAPLGLDGEPNDIQVKQEKNKGKLQAALEALQSAGGGSKPKSTSPVGGNGTNPPFSQPPVGAVGQGYRPANFSKIVINGKATITPFSAGAKPTVSSNWGVDRGSHTHAGVDFAVPKGTQVLSPVNGTVMLVVHDNTPGDYGNYIDVVGDDGMRYRYAHLSMTKATRGMKVTSGQIIGLSGDSGSPGAYHLHFEVRKNQGSLYGFDGTVDPLAHLSNNMGKSHNMSKPRGNNADSPMPYGGGYVQYYPKNSLPLPDGGYLLNGRYYKSGSPKGGTQVQSSKMPIRNGFMSDNPKDYPPNSRTANYGYSALASDKEFAKALADVSTEIGIPAVWLADMMGTEAAHDTRAKNDDGCVGLIQFCPGSTMGWTADQILNMSPAQQVRGPVRAYMKQMKKELSGSIRTPAEMHLAIFGGAGRVLEMRRVGRGYNVSDVNIDRITYVKEMLGRAKGRKYLP